VQREPRRKGSTECQPVPQSTSRKVPPGIEVSSFSMTSTSAIVLRVNSFSMDHFSWDISPRVELEHHNLGRHGEGWRRWRLAPLFAAFRRTGEGRCEVHRMKYNERADHHVLAEATWWPDPRRSGSNRAVPARGGGSVRALEAMDAPERSRAWRFTR